MLISRNMFSIYITSFLVNVFYEWHKKSLMKTHSHENNISISEMTSNHSERLAKAGGVEKLKLTQLCMFRFEAGKLHMSKTSLMASTFLLRSGVDCRSTKFSKSNRKVLSLPILPIRAYLGTMKWHNFARSIVISIHMQFHDFFVIFKIHIMNVSWMSS